MIEVTPNYYHKFKCMADKCTHNCCIGWEIDIDEDTMQFYNSLDTQLGKRIRESIEGDVPHFILSDGDRCPFLKENGLCEIICECGEDALCDICTLHPRFRNFYSSFAETGLGLCCEEAARIILSEENKFSIEVPDDIDLSDEETELFGIRQRIFGILQDRDESIKNRFSRLAREYGLEFEYSIDKLCKLYLSLERLDESWTDELDRLQSFNFEGRIFDDEEFQIPFEQMAVYFVFRHLGDAVWDGDYATRVNFVLMSCYLIGALAEYYLSIGGVSFEKLTDLARMYSSEVEYSQENIDVLMGAG
ncbi:MAG: flagellin lysine-N-methylase [Eubacteriales bacterium]|nr:flagellin lysine-N-methylase [Eubacteriales bacterium]